MRVTIDSAEPIENVIRVVGALYGVTLNVGEGESVSRPTATRGRGRGRPRGSTTRGPQRAASRRGRRSGGAVDASAVREWARGQGLAVSDRGRISSDVLAAYRSR